MITKTRSILIIPTAINLVCAVNASIIQNRRKGLDGEVILPSLRNRARMAVYESGVLPVQQIMTDEKTPFTR